MFFFSNLGFYSVVQFLNYSIDLYQKKKLLQFYRYLPAAGDAVSLSFISLLLVLLFRHIMETESTECFPSKYLPHLAFLL